MITNPMLASPYNRVDRIGVHLGLGGLVTGYRFTKRLDETINSLNSQGRRVTAMYRNQWGLLRWAGAQLLMTVTLTFVTLFPSVLVVSEPMSQGVMPAGGWQPRP
jgi:hypothetical protein